ncbi:uncharacterized protein CTHT_0004270 [Thermochaetoides thermophila DSM 1495]|uniref:Uncharacterized protein n=1 Tax=Chaetomium thermophilum (strain DSM 1495 / CBS 144.50 / IMI 039719) TaxID=759272 RepID=G0RZU8_CHATD|nr:hypothetical protein CTHT_0004270 [Thermochaetoides thermophila DSM 1495]EGS23726.1 hypothetical protein CTHT_0004270 [Thermochaetoides thermophila DSM 1495]
MDGRKSDRNIQEKQPQSQQQKWKRIDQNALGEGQFFGKNVHHTVVVNGSIRSVSRAGTPNSARSPYFHDTHNLAAASMFDLNNLGPGRRGSQSSLNLKAAASDINLRGRFRANNMSSISLTAPNPAFAAPSSSRPGTANGRSKPWVNPLDVHFCRNTPSGPATPKSPLATSPLQLPPTPTTDDAESKSVFGEDADKMVEQVMASVNKMEEEAKKARERERELEKQRETARLEMQRLERQKSTESTLSMRRPSVAQTDPEPDPEPLPALPALPDPEPAAAPKANPNSRPSSRGGPTAQIRSPLIHQGPPPTDPPTQSLPQLPAAALSRQGSNATVRPGTSGSAASSSASQEASSPTIVARPFGAAYQGITPSSPTSGSPNTQGAPKKIYRPYRPSPLTGPSLLNPGLGATSPPPKSPLLGKDYVESPVLGGYPPSAARANDEVKTPDAPKTPVQETKGLEPLLASLTSPSNMTSPATSIRRLSLDEEPIDQSLRPIIREVTAKRETVLTPRQHSLSMKIEELEKSLLTAQRQAHMSTTEESKRDSMTSSFYDEMDKFDDDDDGPILPAPLRIHPAERELTATPSSPRTAALVTAPVASPPTIPATGPVSSPPTIPAAAPAKRPESPFRIPVRRGPPPRRPTLDEYGVSPSQVSRRAGTATPTSRSGSFDDHSRGPSLDNGSRGGSIDNYSRSNSLDNYSVQNSPASRAQTPQLRHPNWRRDPPPAPSPIVEEAPPHPPNPNGFVDTGFNFDFGPSVACPAPPTPDSANWPLQSSVPEKPAASPPRAITESPEAIQSNHTRGRLARANVPPPLNLQFNNFNFSPDAPSRDPTLFSQKSLLTPPLRTAPPPTTGSMEVDSRPDTSSRANGVGNGSAGLAASPRLVSQFPPDDDRAAAFMGIGVARGPSIRQVRRPPQSQGGRLEMVDEFGTGFI